MKATRRTSTSCAACAILILVYASGLGVLFLLFVFTASTSTVERFHLVSVGHNLLDELEQIVTKDALNLDGVPCASMALVENGTVTSRVITKGPEDSDTIFQACSISKSITSLAVAALVDAGRLTYETKVATHIPKNVVDCVVESETAHLFKYVTVGMILSHTAGFSQGGFPGYPGEAATAEAIICGKHPSNTPKLRFISFPGAEFSYSGGGYVILQVFLEELLQRNYPDIMRELVLDPLGMSRSHYGNLTTTETNYARAHYTAYTESEKAYHVYPELAAAALWTTPTDLMAALLAVQQSLHSKDGFLQPETARQMLTHTDQSAGRDNYALGWFSDDHVFGHAGSNDPGFRCYYFGYHGGVVNTDHGILDTQNITFGFAVMTNSAYGEEVIEKIVGALYYLQDWPRLDSYPSNFGAGKVVPYVAYNSPHLSQEWRRWAGIWDSQWHIFDDHGPMLGFAGQVPARLRPAAAPIKQYDNEKSEFLLVADGLQISVRLTWRDNKRVVRLLQKEEILLTKRKDARS